MIYYLYKKISMDGWGFPPRSSMAAANSGPGQDARTATIGNRKRAREFPSNIIRNILERQKRGEGIKSARNEAVQETRLIRQSEASVEVPVVGSNDQTIVKTGRNCSFRNERHRDASQAVVVAGYHSTRCKSRG